MPMSKSNTGTEDVPFLKDLDSFYKHVKAKPPLNKDFDIRQIDPEVMRNYDYVAAPFRHSFYCIAFFLQGDITLNTGFWKSHLQKPALYIKTPHQIVSWIKPEKWLKEYFIVFTETFIRNYKVLADLIFDLPFFKLEKAIPLELEPEEIETLTELYKRIFEEYQSEHKDKFELIASYMHTLLIYVRRIYNRYAASDNRLESQVRQNDVVLVEHFRALIKKNISGGELEKVNRSIKYYAAQLSTHPNHLNAVVKRCCQKTAIAFMHEQIVHEAKSLLSQTQMHIKEISFRLGFNDAPHFINFFKKQEGLTPVQFRKGDSQ